MFHNGINLAESSSLSTEFGKWFFVPRPDGCNPLYPPSKWNPSLHNNGAEIIEIVSKVRPELTMVLTSYSSVGVSQGTSHGNKIHCVLIEELAKSFEPLRESTQLQELMRLIKEARKGKETSVISISREGVALGLSPLSIFEMAGVASI